MSTGIYKQPVAGRVPLNKLGLEGDGQADLSVHGGEAKAVYCYPEEHYDFWRRELHKRDLPTGIFGENFTTRGLLETAVYIGDRFSIGSAEVMVTQPRLPCYKLGIRFESDDMVGRFLASQRSGFYLEVTLEGNVGAGDKINVIARNPLEVSVAEVNRLYIAKTFSKSDSASAKRALKSTALPESWKESFREQLREAKDTGGEW